MFLFLLVAAVDFSDGAFEGAAEDGGGSADDDDAAAAAAFSVASSSASCIVSFPTRLSQLPSSVAMAVLPELSRASLLTRGGLEEEDVVGRIEQEGAIVLATCAGRVG